MLAIVPSATLLGAEGRPVSVEVHVSNGLPAFSVVGLPDEACRESRDRVPAALMSSGLTWPLEPHHRQPRAVGVRKSGAGLDLAIAVGVLVASASRRFGGARRPRLPRRARSRWLHPPGAGRRAAGRRARTSGSRSSQAGARRRPAGCPGRGAFRRHGGGTGRRAGRRSGLASAGPTAATRTGRAGPRSGRRPRPPSWPVRRWRWRRPAGTICSASGRRGRARQCSPSACPPCCRAGAGCRARDHA